jgi:hypothetical protein
MAVSRKGGAELPLPVFRFAPAGAAVGQGVGWGPQGSPLPDPARLGPICEKSRFQDAKPTLLHIQECYKP